MHQKRVKAEIEALNMSSFNSLEKTIVHKVLHRMYF